MRTSVPKHPRQPKDLRRKQTPNAMAASVVLTGNRIAPGASGEKESFRHEKAVGWAGRDGQDDRPIESVLCRHFGAHRQDDGKVL